MKPGQHTFDFKVPEGLWESNICVEISSTHMSAFLRGSINGEAFAEYWVYIMKRFSVQSLM